MMIKLLIALAIFAVLGAGLPAFWGFEVNKTTMSLGALFAITFLIAAFY